MSSSSTFSSLEEAKREAQREVAECEKEIGAIKALVKSLATAGRSSSNSRQQQQEAAAASAGGGGTDSSSSVTATSADAAALDAAAADNALTVVLLKVEGLTDESKDEEEEEQVEQQSATKKECKVRLSLQLSSPIEEGVLSEIFDDGAGIVDSETMKVTFRGVETNQATLTLTATNVDNGAEIGTSEPLDLSFITKLDVMTNPTQEYVTDLPVVLYPDAKQEQASQGGDGQPSPVAAAASCTVTIRLAFVPSQKDLLEELYELLNKETTRKTRAVDKLRQVAAMASRQSAAAAQQQQQMAMQPAVRAGFLNKTPKQKEADQQPSKLRMLYDRYLGPQTLWRQLLPLTKNYIIFAVAVSAMHFKGHNLALPPPV